MSSGMNGTKSRGGFASFAELSDADLRDGVTVWVHGGSRYDIYASDPGGATQIANGNWAKEITGAPGSGEANTAANIGVGTGVFAQKSGVELQFKSFKTAGSIAISSDADSVTFDTSNLIPDGEKGVPNGVATLQGDGKIPASQLPSYVDDVLEFPTFGDFPATGESGKIYVALDTNTQYRWTGSTYVAFGSGSTTWGSITGTLANQTDLQAALNAKQDTLVSGTNIKTINGESILGTGDIDTGTPSGGKQLTNKTTDPTGNLPAWAAWIADSSGGALTRPMNPTPSDGEEATAIDISENAQTNNITLTVVPPTTINDSVIDKNGQSKKWRYDATGDVWDLVFSDAPASGTGPAYQVETKILYISDGLISETDTGAKLSADRREVVDIETHLGLGWSSEELWIQTEIFNDTGSGAAGWSNPEFVNAGGGIGVRSLRKTNEIIVQSGGSSPFPGASSFAGNAFGLVLASQPTAKTRILVTRLTYAGGLDLVDSAVINVGTIAANSRYTFDIATQLGASWVGANILTVCQIQVGGEWGATGWVYIADANGAEAGMLNTDTIVVQTGRGSIITANGNESGHPFGAITVPTTAPCRILCYKFTDGAIADGIVASETYSLGNLADNTRTVAALSTINPDFVGKHLAVLAEVQQPTNLWGAGGWWTTSNIALGCRANQQYDAIVTQSGTDSITSISNLDGSPHGTPNYTANRFLAPTRLKLWRFG